MEDYMKGIIRIFTITLIGFILLNSHLLAEERTNEAIFKLTVSNASAKDKVETIVSMLKGVKEAEVNVEKKELQVEYNPNHINPDMISYAVKSLGFDAIVIEDKEKVDKEKSN